MVALNTQTAPFTVSVCAPGAVPGGMLIDPPNVPSGPETSVPISLPSKSTWSGLVGAAAATAESHLAADRYRRIVDDDPATRRVGAGATAATAATGATGATGAASVAKPVPPEPPLLPGPAGALRPGGR